MPTNEHVVYQPLPQSVLQIAVYLQHFKCIHYSSTELQTNADGQLSAVCNLCIPSTVMQDEFSGPPDPALCHISDLYRYSLQSRPTVHASLELPRRPGSSGVSIAVQLQRTVTEGGSRWPLPQLRCKLPCPRYSLWLRC